MATSSYSTPIGTGLAALMGGLTSGNSAASKLLGLKAESYGNRNLASSLLAQQRQFDLDNQRKAFETQQGLIDADPENASLQQMLQGMQLGKPKDFVSGANLQAKEARFNQGLTELGDKNFGVVDSTGVTQPVDLATVMRLGGNFSQIGSASQGPSAVAENVAQTLGHTQGTDAVTALQDALKGNKFYIGEGENRVEIPYTALTSAEDLLKINKGNLQIEGLGIENTIKDIKKDVAEETLTQAITKSDYDALQLQILENTQGDVEGLASAKHELKSLEVALTKTERELPYVKGSLKVGKDGNFFGVNKKGERVNISVAAGKNNKVVPQDYQRVELTDVNGSVTEVMFVSPTATVRTMNELRARDKDPKRVYTPRELGATPLGLKNRPLKGAERTKLMNKFTKGDQIAARIEENMQIIKDNPEVVGLVGKIEKFKEFTEQFNNVKVVEHDGKYVMYDSTTNKIVTEPATRFALNALFLRAETRKAIIGESRVSDTEQKIVNEIVDGQQIWTTVPSAMQALSQLGEIMENFREVAAADLKLPYERTRFKQVVTDLGGSPQAPPVSTAPAQGNSVNPVFSGVNDKSLLENF